MSDKPTPALDAVTIAAAAKCVPTNWCDELLTGKDAPSVPMDCRGIEKLLRGIQDRIRSLPSSPVGDGWQTIESAPVGKWILVCNPTHGDGIFAAWNRKDKGGWIDGMHREIYPQPLYWRPLPAPPDASNKG